LRDFLAALERKTLVLGVDPRLELHTKIEASYDYSLSLIRALEPQLAAVKFQSAFFEAMGAEGINLLFRLIEKTQQLLPVIIDAKRGDVPETARAYARAYLEAFPGAALTVNPYLGQDSLVPFLEAAQKYRGTVFVLLKTSNPGAGTLQDLPVAGQKLWQCLAQDLANWAEEYRHREWSRLGVVFGATYPAELKEAVVTLPHSPCLVPGVGAQGVELVAGAGILVSASRSLYYPGGKPNLEAAIAAGQALAAKIALAKPLR
jgi:orotidine-5'-phosphate decarboxylase